MIAACLVSVRQLIQRTLQPGGCKAALVAHARAIFSPLAHFFIQVSVVTLDKTGTLTKGSFQLVGCHPRPGWAQPQLLRLLGSLERGSSHPLAAAVLGYAAAQVGGSGPTRFCCVDGFAVETGVAAAATRRAGSRGAGTCHLPTGRAWKGALQLGIGWKGRLSPSLLDLCTATHRDARSSHPS